MSKAPVESEQDLATPALTEDKLFWRLQDRSEYRQYYSSDAEK